MILQKKYFTNATQTFVQINGRIYCHSNNGSECLVFPAKHNGIECKIDSWNEILDQEIIDRVMKIVED